jgi:hypothetical protein
VFALKDVQLVDKNGQQRQAKPPRGAPRSCRGAGRRTHIRKLDVTWARHPHPTGVGRYAP